MLICQRPCQKQKWHMNTTSTTFYQCIKSAQNIMQLTNHLLGNCAENKMLELYSRIDRWMTCDYTSFSTVFQSYQDNGWVIMKDCVQ